MTWIANSPKEWDGEVAVILSHGAGQGIDSPFMTFFQHALSECGFLTVMFNFEYMQKKKKVPDPQPQMQALYRLVVSEVVDKHRPRTVVIGGKSMGGRVASYIAADTPAVNGLVFLGYPLHPPGKPDQLRDAHLYEIHLPMLFLSGTRDTFARRDLLEDVVQRLGPRATLIWTEGGDHSLRVGKSEAPLRLAVGSIEQWIHANVSANRP
jgi:predicted alpha/beta-hydrolase family hydrolase